VGDDAVVRAWLVLLRSPVHHPLRFSFGLLEDLDW